MIVDFMNDDTTTMDHLLAEGRRNIHIQQRRHSTQNYTNSGMITNAIRKVKRFSIHSTASICSCCPRYRTSTAVCASLLIISVAFTVYTRISHVTLPEVPSRGAFRFANYYQDHMVLQRAPQRAIIWGYTDTFNTPITLTINNKVYHTISSSSSADSVGVSTWSVTLNAQTQEGPFRVKVTQPLTPRLLESIILNDVLFGDVWICSGQSNMELAVNEMFNASTELANADKYPKIRLFTPAETESVIPREEVLTIGLNWSVASNASVGSIYTSAICWLYGRMVQERLGGRPMGLIHTSWQGTVVEHWSPPEVLKECGITNNGRWVQNKYPVLGRQLSLMIKNTVLYNAMIHPFTKMVIKGIIWYQGESNSDYNIDKYSCTFSKMIKSWRAIWHRGTHSNTDPTFPFGFVQLATWDTTGTKVGEFPWIRWHQTFDVGYVPNDVVPNVFMAVALDLRDDEEGMARSIHPRDKLDVGYRLSRSGLAVAYGYKDIKYLGPIVADVSVASDSSKVNVTYSNVASSSIELRDPNGFEVCCAGKNACNSTGTAWIATPASKMKGGSLTISLAVPNSCVWKTINGLRYLWKETPCLFKQAAVYNGDDSNLPAPPYIHYF